MHQSISDSLTKIFGEETRRGDEMFTLTEDRFRSALPQLQEMQLATPCGIVPSSSGMFLRLRLMRPFFEFSVFVETDDIQSFFDFVTRITPVSETDINVG